jgi:hypothetical protein
MHGGSEPSGSLDSGPGATRVRFEVLSSDATQPLRAFLFASWEDSPSFGTVWDGTKSTGAKFLDVLPSRELPPLVIVTVNGSNSQTINVKWAFTALDANGKDVGFTCTG